MTESKIDRQKLLAIYGRLRGLDEALNSLMRESVIDGHYADDLTSIADQLGKVLHEDMSHFRAPPNSQWGNDSESYTKVSHLKGRVIQALRFLETGYHLGAEVVEIGTLYNAIRDEELRSRCADLLSAPGNFDRVINQATQVLEDRIRRKWNPGSSQTGPTLVRAAVPQTPQTGALVVSDSAEEQEGIGHIGAGLMLAFRNPTHHHLTDKFTRENALKVCAFVDELLHMIDAAKIKS
ncbi:TIGR02391 family protein [Taklimakanibacter deserti]|uniref:TIGR02391 family protein n=1 Tax=Taklimakanibacter deserti TaxID=2267839 RepID=UPI000E648854